MENTNNKKTVLLLLFHCRHYEPKIFNVLSYHLVSFVNIHPVIHFKSKKVGMVKHLPLFNAAIAFHNTLKPFCH